MRLAPDAIVIKHGRDAVLLRPSLRAALRLQRKHGLGRLVAGVRDGNLAVILDIVAEAENPFLAESIVFRNVQAHLGRALAELHDPLSDFLAISFGIDGEEHPAEQRERKGKRFSIEDTLQELFEVGTGWLGWSPADTWAATPAEIVAAQRGLIAKLNAMHGKAEDQPAYDPRDEVSPEEVQAGIAKLRSLQGQQR